MSPGKGLVENVDVNECLFFPDVCLNGRCRNSVGSFSCRCNQGYAADETGVRCANIDECSLMADVCGNGICVDTPGGFDCACAEGFEVRPMMQVCTDVDECALAEEEGEQPLCTGGRCVNTIGSFR